jgi:outer membrane protein assembly factor BamB
MGISRFIAVCLAGLGAALLPDVLAADAPSSALPGDLYNKDNTAGVYVRDSAVAMEKMALGQRMANLEQWSKAADIYQEILEKYSDRVVPSLWDDQQRPVQYTSVTEAVRQALCKWPAAGLDVYRARYETTAANLLAGAGGDGAKLHQILWLYFPTDSGRDAGIQLMDLYFESGDYAAVGQIGRRLLKWHPNLVAQRPMVIYRVALADKLCGDDEDAQRQFDELRRQWPQATGTIGGRDVVLTDLLAQQMSTVGAVEATGSDSWVTIGGDFSRNKVSTTTIRPGARLYSLALPGDQSLKDADPNVRRELAMQDATQEQMGARLGIMPVVDHGQLFFQDNVNLYGVDLDSGVPLTGWAATWPGGVYKLDGGMRALPAGQQLSLSVSDKYVAAVMGLPDRLGGGGEDLQNPARLVCLDRSSGKLLWTTSTAQLPDSTGALRSAELASSPLIIGENVYVIGHGGPGQQFEDCYVICFNAADGQFRWASYVASAGGDALGVISPDGMIVVSDVVSDLASAGGRIFFITNLGAVAALDAYTGSIEWLNIYRDQNLPPPNNQAFSAILQNRLGVPIMYAPWKYNPALVTNGRVFVFPSDDKYLFIYDAGSGQEIKRIWLSDLPDSSESSKADTILGVRGDWVYLAGPSRAWRLNWQQYDHDKNPIPDDTWATADFDARGRGFLTADALYLPTESALRRIILKNGMIDPRDGTFPKNNWDAEQEGPGNVIAAEDHVIVAGNHYVAVYTDVALARQRLDKQVAAAPGDPGPRLHYAEVMFASGQIDIALSKLQEAFGLLASNSDPAMRGRAFNDAMRFAARLAARPADSAQISQVFDLAAIAATSPMQKSEYRLDRARFDHSQGADPAAIALYQEILADPSMSRAAVLDPTDNSDAPAALIVRREIAQILQSPQGKAAYAQVAKAAEAALDRAKSAGDPLAMRQIAEEYPNSDSAPVAMRYAAAAFESRGDWRPATLQLRHLLSQYPDQPRPVILEEMARNYLKLTGGLATAQGRLALAASAAPDQNLSAPLVLPDGSVLKDMTLSQASGALNRLASPEAPLPDLHLVTTEQRAAYRQRTGRWLADPFAAAQTIPNVQAMVVPLDGFCRYDRLIGWNQKSGLMVFPTQPAGPICNSPDVNLPPDGAAWVDAGLLVWCGDVTYLIDPQSGATRWVADLDATPPPQDQADASAPPERIQLAQPLHDKIILATNLGRLAAINFSDGKIAWQTRPVNHEIDRLLANDDFTVVRCSIDQARNLIVFDSNDGQTLGQKTFASDNVDGPINLALADDGTLVYTLADRLCIQDLFDATPGPDGMEPKFATVPAPEAPQIFSSATDPSQLLIAQGRVFALSDQGKSVRVYDLTTGKSWTFRGPDGQDHADLPLSTDSFGSPNVTLRIHGRYLYVLSPQNLKAYEIDHPWLNWSAPAPVREMRDFEELLFGRDDVIVTDRQRPPLTASYQTGTRINLQAFSRALVNNDPEKESGLGPYKHSVIEPGDITAFQPYEGGIAYFAGGAIHLLPGGRDAITNDKPAN